MFDIKELSRCFARVFSKKVYPEKAVEKMNEYQKLSYIEDAKEFCYKAFEQIKNDFGYKNLNIPLIFGYPKETANASWSPTKCVMRLYQDISKKLDGRQKADIIEYLMHEFRHVRQTEMAYRTSPAELLAAIKENYPRRIAGDMLSQPEETQIKMAESVGKSLKDFQAMLKEMGLREKINYKFFIGGKEASLDTEFIKANQDRFFGKLKPIKKGALKYQ